MQPRDERTLILAIRNGDSAAMEELVKSCWKSLHEEAYAKIGSHAAAEEIVQRMFTEFWDKRTILTDQFIAQLNVISHLNRELKKEVLIYCKGKIREEIKTKHSSEYSARHKEVIDSQEEYRALQNCIKFSH